MRGVQKMKYSQWLGIWTQWRWINNLIFGFMFGLLAVFAGLVSAQEFRFSSIEVTGNKRIESSTILNYASIPVAQVVDAAELNTAYQNISDSGLFESVELQPSDGRLLITVQEFPTVNQIAFEGNKKITNKTLESLVRVKPRRVFNPTDIEQDLEAIVKAYADIGNLATQVTPQIIRQSDNRVDLVFEIFEGGTVEIERISFVGNSAFSDQRLRRVLQTKQAGFLRTVIQRDTFNSDQIEYDKQILKDFYRSKGYIDARVNDVKAELAEERDGYFITFNLREGQQFRFGQVAAVSSLPNVNADEFSAALKIKENSVYAPLAVENDIALLEYLALRKGIEFMKVMPQISRDEANKLLNVTFELTRSKRLFVERINIEGNKGTLDRVIRRYFGTAEGDPFNPRDIGATARRLRASGLFANVDISSRDGSSPEQVIIDIVVTEKATGSLSLGGSYSSAQGFGAALEYGESNFLGRGQSLSLALKGGTDNQVYSLRFTEPSFLYNDLSFSLNAAFRQTAQQNSLYDTTSVIFEPTVGFPMGENGRLALRLFSKNSDITAENTLGDVISAEEDLPAVTSNGLGYTYRFDTRRSGFNPDTGVLFQINQDFSGISGNTSSIKTEAKLIGQTKVLKDAVTLRATLEGGILNYSKGQSRVIDRFSMGSQIMRGFEPGGIGPREYVANSVNDALGGEQFSVARFEADFPLGIPEEFGLSGSVFYDVGSLWGITTSDPNVLYKDSSTRQVVGAAILWATPIGPLRFNFTRALKKEQYDKEQDFEFTLSTQF